MIYIPRKQKVKRALVVEGGGMRSVFSAGVLNAFAYKGFDPFNLYIGVSAGACNLASHLAGQFDRNFDITMAYSITRQFINPWRFLAMGHYMDLDWLWDVTIREYRLDLKRLFGKLKKEHKHFIVTATSMLNGKAMYLVPNENTLEHYLKVSSSLPLFYRKILYVDNEPATDGGIADSIPVMEAIHRGATDITVIRSRSSAYIKKRNSFSFIYGLVFRKYPHIADAMKKRYANYMAAVEVIKNPPRGVNIDEISPPDDIFIGRTTQNKETLLKTYNTGRNYGNKYMEDKLKTLNQSKLV